MPGSNVRRAVVRVIHPNPYLDDSQHVYTNIYTNVNPHKNIDFYRTEKSGVEIIISTPDF